jgi:hypothetical protein
VAVHAAIGHRLEALAGRRRRRKGAPPGPGTDCLNAGCLNVG